MVAVRKLASLAAAASAPLLLLDDDALREVFQLLDVDEWLTLSRVCSQLFRQLTEWRHSLRLAWPFQLQDGLPAFALRAGMELTVAEAAVVTGDQASRSVLLFPCAESLSLADLPLVSPDEWELSTFRRFSIKDCAFKEISPAYAGLLRRLHQVEVVEVSGECDVCGLAAHDLCVECGRLTCPVHLGQHGDSDNDNCFYCGAPTCSMCSTCNPGFHTGEEYKYEDYKYQCRECRPSEFKAASSRL